MTMNDETNPKEPGETGAAAPAKADTPPAETPKGEWKMPAPIFRQTSGKLPEGFEKKVLKGEPAAAPDVTPTPPPAAIQPQPDVSEEFTHAEIFGEQEAETPPKRTGMKLVLAILGILGMVLVAIVFLAIIYFLFFYQGNGINNLN
jgi:hypothetical protein